VGGTPRLLVIVMSHHIYQTRAFVIDHVETGEANVTLSLMTEDLGLVRAAAQGVRHLKSKLRPSIQDLSFSKIALVRGREVWRLTGAEKLISLADRRIQPQIRKLMAKTLGLVKRLSPGEAPNEYLFEAVSRFCSFCFEKKDVLAADQEKQDAAYLLVEFRILHSLGYGSEDEKLVPFSQSAEISEVMLSEVQVISKEMAEHNEQALAGSHL